MSPKNWPLARKRKISGGWFRWESFSPRYCGHLLYQQKSRSLNKKLTFGPKNPNFGVKSAHFHPQRPIGASSVNIFNTKEVSHWLPDMIVPKAFLPPLKIRILGPKTTPNYIFGHYRTNIGLIGPFGPMPNQKTMRTRCLCGFLLCGYQHFNSIPQKLGSLAQKRPILTQNMHFKPNIGLSGTFGAMPDQKNNANEVPRWFSDV